MSVDIPDNPPITIARTVQRVEGFAGIISYSVEESWKKNTGIETRLWTITSPDEEIVWKTAICPKKTDTLFAFNVLTGINHGSLSFSVNGHPAISISHVFKDIGRWINEEGFSLIIVPDNIMNNMDIQIQGGVYYFLVPEKFISEAIACTLGVKMISEDKSARISLMDIKENYLRFGSLRPIPEEMRYSKSVRMRMIRPSSLDLSWEFSEGFVTIETNKNEKFLLGNERDYYWYLDRDEPEYRMLYSFQGSGPAEKPIRYAPGKKWWKLVGPEGEMHSFLDLTTVAGDYGITVAADLSRWGVNSNLFTCSGITGIPFGFNVQGMADSLRRSMVSDQSNWVWTEGMKGTFEAWFFLHGGKYGKNVSGTARILLDPPVVHIDPEYLTGTGVFKRARAGNGEYSDILEQMRNQVSLYCDKAYRAYLSSLSESDGGISGQYPYTPEVLSYWIPEAIFSGDSDLLKKLIRLAYSIADSRYYHRGDPGLKGKNFFVDENGYLPDGSFNRTASGFIDAHCATGDKTFLRIWKNELEWICKESEKMSERQFMERANGYLLKNFVLGYDYLRDSRYLDLAERTMAALIKRKESYNSPVSSQHDIITDAVSIQGMLALYHFNGSKYILAHAVDLADILGSGQRWKNSRQLPETVFLSEAAPLVSTALFELASVIHDDPGFGDRFWDIYASAQNALLISLENAKFSQEKGGLPSSGIKTTVNAALFAAICICAELSCLTAAPFIISVETPQGGKTTVHVEICSCGSGSINLCLKGRDSEDKVKVVIGGFSPKTIINAEVRNMKGVTEQFTVRSDKMGKISLKISGNSEISLETAAAFSTGPVNRKSLKKQVVPLCVISKHSYPDEKIPVEVSIPFAKQDLFDTGTLSLVCKQAELPVTANVLEYWEDRSIKWVRLHFMTPEKGWKSNMPLELRYGAPSKVHSDVLTEWLGEMIVVNTGKLQAVFSTSVDKHGFIELKFDTDSDTKIRDEANLLSGLADFPAVVDCNGYTHITRRSAETQVKASANPVFSQVTFEELTGSDFASSITYTFYYDSPIIKINTTIEFYPEYWRTLKEKGWTAY